MKSPCGIGFGLFHWTPGINSKGEVGIVGVERLAMESPFDFDE
jgi:hypothetical protein